MNCPYCGSPGEHEELCETQQPESFITGLLCTAAIIGMMLVVCLLDNKYDVFLGIFR